GLFFWAVFIGMQHTDWASAIFKWLLGLVFWLFALNLGVGLFNLVPLGPIDGGRMLHTTLSHFVHHRHAKRIWHSVSAVMLAIIAVTVISAFV
ncbi:MAG: site-2 protease family protein, partial [Candidatus Woesearchaeota archaeon]